VTVPETTRAVHHDHEFRMIVWAFNGIFVAGFLLIVIPPLALALLLGLAILAIAQRFSRSAPDSRLVSMLTGVVFVSAAFTFLWALGQ
jgi:hypothetical protein